MSNLRNCPCHVTNIFPMSTDFMSILRLFVCGISLTSGQLIIELFPDCTRSCFSQVVSRRRGGDRIYEMRCLFVAVGLNARFIVLPHWDNMSQAYMLTHPVTLYLLCLCVTPQLVKLQIRNRSHVCYVMGGCSSAFIHTSKSCRLRPDR